MGLDRGGVEGMHSKEHSPQPCVMFTRPVLVRALGPESRTGHKWFLLSCRMCRRQL